jgi:hypothetical protein
MSNLPPTLHDSERAELLALHKKVRQVPSTAFCAFFIPRLPNRLPTKNGQSHRPRPSRRFAPADVPGQVWPRIPLAAIKLRYSAADERWMDAWLLRESCGSFFLLMGATRLA